MTMQRIPTTADPYSTQRTILDGTEYVLRFSYNAREDRWAFDLLTDDEVVLLSGCRIVPEVYLLRRYHYMDRMPPGEILCLSYQGDAPPGLNDLLPGGRCELLYVSAADLISLST